MSVLAICLETLLRRNWPSVHDVPSYLDGPSVGHMALSWATIQVLAAVLSLPKGETKTPPVSASLRSFSSLLFPTFFCLWFCKQSLTSSCTHLTPDPSDKAHSAVGATSRGSSYSETLHHNGLRLLPAFSELCPPNPVCPHTPLFFSAVDGAWEYLLFSCCCQQF